MGRIHVLCIFQHSVGSFLWQGSAFPGPSGWIAGLKSRTICSSGAKDTSRLRVQTPRNWPKETHLNNPRQLSSQSFFFLAVWGSSHPECGPTGASCFNYHWLPLSLSIVSVLQPNHIRRLFFIRHCAPK
jgi:hypothetical protein